MEFREPDWEEMMDITGMIELGMELDDRQLWIWRNYMD
jgi:hypothetical protein